MKMTVNMKGLQKWMQKHPRRRTDGWFSINGKELTHEQVKTMIDYAVQKGYRTDADIQEEVIAEILFANKGE
jgi:hypothetical protein